jgi:hypothetical protein
MYVCVPPRVREHVGGHFTLSKIRMSCGPVHSPFIQEYTPNSVDAAELIWFHCLKCLTRAI